MKKILTAIIAATIITGCASPSADMMNNNFTNIIPKDSALRGYWSGSSGPFLVTFKFNGDGTGLMCSSHNGKDVIEKLKIADGVMYMQNGLKQTIIENTNTSLVLKINYFGSATFKYSPDPQLTNASPYCEKNIQ